MVYLRRNRALPSDVITMKSVLLEFSRRISTRTILLRKKAPVSMVSIQGQIFFMGEIQLGKRHLFCHFRLFTQKQYKSTKNFIKFYFSLCLIILKLDGNSEIGAHVYTEIVKLACLRQLFRSTAVLNLFSCARAQLSYHLI